MDPVVTRCRVTIEHPRGELVLWPNDVDAITRVLAWSEGEGQRGEIVAVRTGDRMRARVHTQAADRPREDQDERP